MAEAMNRHNRDIDIYHAGRFAGLGSRHNVMHWGCSAKQLRISTAMNRRFHYYLTADERTGDVLQEVAEADRALAVVNPHRKLRGEPFAPDVCRIGVGTDYGAVASNWLTAWERTGDPMYHQWLETTMSDIGASEWGFFTGAFALDLELKRLTPPAEAAPHASHLSIMFGLPEVIDELLQILDVPQFAEAWLSTPVRKFDDVSTSRHPEGFGLCQPNHEAPQVVPGVFPLEGLGTLLVTNLKGQDAILQFEDRLDVVGRKDLALQDGEVDLDLVEPAGVDRKENRLEAGPDSLKSDDGGIPAMHRAIVEDEEDTMGRPVRWLRQDLRDESIEGRNAGPGLAATEEPGPMHVPSGEVGQRTTPLVFMFDPRRLARPSRPRGMGPYPRLDAGLLVSTQDIFVRTQRVPVPLAVVEVQNPVGLRLEVRIAGEDPGAMIPGAQGVLLQPTPHRTPTDLGHDPSRHDFASDLGGTEAGQRDTAVSWQLARQRLHPHDHLRGENRAVGPVADHPPSLPGVAHETACATC